MAVLSRAEWIRQRRALVSRIHEATDRSTVAAEPWLWSAHPWRALVVSALGELPERPTRREALLVVDDDGDGTPGRPQDHDDWWWQHGPQESLEGISWPYVRLHELGEALRSSREAWDRSHPPQSMDLREAWRSWGTSAVWDHREQWEAVLRRPVLGVVRRVLSTRGVNGHAAAQAMEAFDEALWFQLLGGDGEVTPGWAELATHTLESGPRGPIASLWSALDEDGRSRAARCISRRGAWPNTVASVLPELRGAAVWAPALTTRVLDAEDAARLVDLHVALRVIAAWSEDPGEPARDRRVIKQHQGRARARLRALVSEQTAGQVTMAVSEVPDLTARTIAAAKVWAWGWAWQSIGYGLELDITRAVHQPCRDRGAIARIEDDAALRTWVLLVILRGRWPHLQRWCRTGSGGHDGVWGRLLSKDLPAMDLGGAGRPALRGWCLEHAEDVAQRWRALLVDLAAQPAGRDLRRRVDAALEPHWHADIPRPRSGFPTMCRSAAQWLDLEEGS